MAKKTLTVKLIKSMHGRIKGHKECVLGLGLKRINHSKTIEDTSANRGMINKVNYLLSVEEGK